MVSYFAAMAPHLLAIVVKTPGYKGQKTLFPHVSMKAIGTAGTVSQYLMHSISARLLRFLLQVVNPLL